MKAVHQILPVSLYDIPGLERWLEEQADHGLFPTHIGSYVSFAKSGVPGTRFRLEPWGAKGTEPTAEQMELYSNAGWEYAFPVARAYFLFYTVSPDAPELYSDLATRGQSLERLARQIKRVRTMRMLIPAAVLVAVLAALLWPASRFDAQPDRWAILPLLLLQFTDPIFLVFVFTFLLQLPRELREYRLLLSTYESLKAGLAPLPSQIPRKRVARENIALLALLPVLLLCLVLNHTLPQGQPLEAFALPYISLSELEREPTATHQELFGYDTRWSAEENQAVRLLSLLSPTWYQTSQSGYGLRAGTQVGSFSPDPEGGRYRYAPDLQMTRFSLLFPGLSRPVAKAQMDDYRAVNLRWSYEEMEYPGVDFVILAQTGDGTNQMAAIGRGKALVVFSYAGQELLAEHLELLSSMVLD